MLKLATEQDDAERQAREMFQRVLVGWASDALTLRASGLDRPGHRRGALGVSPMRIRRTGPATWTPLTKRVA